jgi:hypothetical protein
MDSFLVYFYNIFSFTQYSYLLVLAHGRWFSPASSTTKTGRHDIAEILLKVALNTINQIKSNHRILIPLARSIFNNIWEITDNRVSMMNIKNKSRYTGVFPLSSKPEGKYPWASTWETLSLATVSRVHLFCNLQSRVRTHAVLVIGLYELLCNPTT